MREGSQPSRICPLVLNPLDEWICVVIFKTGHAFSEGITMALLCSTDEVRCWEMSSMFHNKFSEHDLLLLYINNALSGII